MFVFLKINKPVWNFNQRKITPTSLPKRTQRDLGTEAPKKRWCDPRYFKCFPTPTPFRREKIKTAEQKTHVKNARHEATAVVVALHLVVDRCWEANVAVERCGSDAFGRFASQLGQGATTEGLAVRASWAKGSGYMEPKKKPQEKP